MQVEGPANVHGYLTFANGRDLAQYVVRDVHGWGGHYTADCPANQYVCGITVRDEGGQGSGDDSGINGLHIRCCTFGRDP